MACYGCLMLNLVFPHVHARIMVPPHCYHDTLVLDVKEPFDPSLKLLEDLMCAPLGPLPSAAFSFQTQHQTPLHSL